MMLRTPRKSSAPARQHQLIARNLIVASVATLVGIGAFFTVTNHHQQITFIRKNREQLFDKGLEVGVTDQTYEQTTSAIELAPIQDAAWNVQLPDGQPWYNFQGVKVPLILTDQNFAQVAALHVHKETNTVVFSTFRGGIKPEELWMGQNQYLEHAKIGMEKNLMIICTTRTTAINAWRKSTPFYWTTLTHAGKPLSEDPTITKWLIAARLLAAGYNALFVDFDLGYRCNPFDHFNKTSDINILWDEFYFGGKHAGCTNGVSVNVGGKSVSGKCASTGFWYIKASQYMGSFCILMYEHSLHSWEQTTFNRIIELFDAKTGQLPASIDTAEANSKVQHLQVTLLMHPHFVNIINIKDLKKQGLITADDDICMLHCGAIAGGKAKEDAMREWGLYNPEKYKNDTDVHLQGYGGDVDIPYFPANKEGTIWL